jgi:hypothetical protein
LSRLVPLVLALGLAVLVGAHVAILVGLVRAGSWRRAGMAMLLPPLAPWWAFEAGMRARTMAWAGGLVLYCASVAAA